MATYRLRDVYIVEYDVVADSLDEAMELGSPEDTYPHAEYADTVVVSVDGIDYYG